MTREASSPSPIPNDRSCSPGNHTPNHNSRNDAPIVQNDTAATTPTPPVNRSNRPSRACTIRAAARLHAAAAPSLAAKPKKKEQRQDESPQQKEQCSKIVTQLVGPPPPSLLPRWTIRSMWELASVLNFLHVFRPLLNISLEFSAEEFETALITPNDTLSDIHMPLLKAIPPITRMALTRDTWVTVLCRKLRDWWHWVADGELPIVASHGVEVEVYKTLDPGLRVVILKALCDIRVEQEDIRNYIDNSLKHGVQLSAFRKERTGGDSHGIFYWYEDDPIIGHRLYREIRKAEVKKAKTKGSQVLPNALYQWETVATNLDEFEDVFWLIVGRGLKIYSGGISWKKQGGGKAIEVDKADIMGVTWMKVPRTNQLGVRIKDGLFYKFTGFRDQDVTSLTNFFESTCGITPEEKQLSVSGHNWGEVDLNERFIDGDKFSHT